MLYRNVLSPPQFISVGSLVRFPHNNLGIGKVTDVTLFDAIVEYFVSVGDRIKVTVPLQQLVQVRLERHTRCYLWSEEQETWQIGRVYQWYEDDQRYEIDLPNGKLCYANESEIYVRCNRAIEDPIDVLVMKGQETPFFHQRRSAFVRCLMEQRSVSRGMLGLFSAAIDLYRHQVEVVRRVLEDPLQRYLLADEVGLGKTIEAAAILRQYLLDDPNGTAMVIAPRVLLEQWRQELEQKFHLRDEVQFLTVEELSRTRLLSAPHFLIIDEAHHIAAMASSPDPLEQERFEDCKQLAHQADRLLLLSATPALNHEAAFLAMLHLLDPITYRLEDLEGFKERVRLRQDIGRVLLSFSETSPPFALKLNLGKLRTLFPADAHLLEYLSQLEAVLQSSSCEAAERSILVRKIRNHISDTYRLHRRMLRSRRATVEDVLRDQTDTRLRVEYDLDERSPRVDEDLDNWRLNALTVASDPHNLYWQQLQNIFLLLFRASGTWLELLQWAIVSRLSDTVHPGLVQAFGTEATQCLVEAPLFSQEEEILRAMLETLQQPSEEGDRFEHLEAVINNLKQSNRQPLKIAVFSSFSPTCEAIIKRLVEAFGEQAVACYLSNQSPEAVAENSARFRDDSNCFLLVCDATGEEGHNLQFADWMIHFDLPWSPNRLEQRNGRMNRIGLKHSLQFIVFAGADVTNSLHDAWFQLLRQGFRAFQDSIASLQFYVDRKLPELEMLLFQLGAEGLSQSIQTVAEEIAEEKIKIDEQNALDEIDALEEEASQYFQNLDDYDAQHQAMQSATEAWICQTLQFRRIFQNDTDNVVRYQPTRRGSRETLIPVSDLRDRFQRHLTEPGTYSRYRVLQSPGTRLYRIGNGFVDALADYVHWDDRGQAFALWRHEETWSPEAGLEWLGFRFDYMIEPDLSQVEAIFRQHNWSQANVNALARRADAMCPPFVETIYLDAHMNLIEEPQLLNILRRPYSDQRQPARDYNLANKRLEILDEFISEDNWELVCRNARSHSERLLRERPDFGDRCQRYANQAARKLQDRVDQLHLRLERQSQPEPKLAQEVQVEAALQQVLVNGIFSPKIRLDSVGFYIISGQPPRLIRREQGE